MTALNVRPILVCGDGPVAARTFAVLRERGFAVLTAATYDGYMPVAAVVECGVGLQPSFDTVMRALGLGIPVVTTNALLVAVHGRVLTNAAWGQQTAFGFGGALGVLQPFAGWLPTAGVTRVTVATPYGANAILQRMLQRNDEAHKAQVALELQGMDMRNAAGKQDYVLGLVLQGAIGGQWLAPEASQRTGVEVMTPMLLAQMRRFGLAPLYTVVVEDGFVRAGVVACVPTSPLMQGVVQEVAVVETAAGAQVMTRSVVVDEAVAQAVATDVAVAVQGGRVKRHVGGFAAAGKGQYMLVGEYVLRHRVLEAGCVVLDEQITADGTWVAVVEGAAAPVVGGVMVVPVSGGFEVGTAALRLVG